jgi:hypothetical protein
MRLEVNCAVATCWSRNVGDVGDALVVFGADLTVEEGGWARGAQLSVYMVLNGISYVPGYESMCSRMKL